MEYPSIVNLLGPWWTAWSTAGLVDQPYEEMVAAFMARFLDMDLAKVAGRIPWDSMGFHGSVMSDGYIYMDIYIFIYKYINTIDIILLLLLLFFNNIMIMMFIMFNFIIIIYVINGRY